MRLAIKIWLPAVAGAFTGGLALLSLAGPASAQCSSGCTPPPPPPCNACQPPPPPPPPPPPTGCCTPPPPPGGGNLNVTVNVNANATSASSAGINARLNLYGNVRGVGGGGVYFNVDQPYPTVIQGLNVEAGAATQVIRVPYEARRRWEKRVVVQAFCIDDRDIPHPASQVTPDREISDGYEGELYRCIAGTRLQVTWSEWTGQVSFEGGQTFACQKGEALWRDRSGALICRTQIVQRDCNERSLLRRYGAGIKILVWVKEETYTEYREEVVQTQGASIAGASIMLDGGVGGRVF